MGCLFNVGVFQDDLFQGIQIQVYTTRYIFPHALILIVLPPWYHARIILRLLFYLAATLNMKANVTGLGGTMCLPNSFVPSFFLFEGRVFTRGLFGYTSNA